MNESALTRFLETLRRGTILLAAALVGGVAGAIWPRAALLARYLYWAPTLFPDDVEPAESLWPRLGLASWAAIVAVILTILVMEERRARPIKDQGSLLSPAAWFILIGALTVLLADVLGQMAARVRFPVDLLLWSEGPFVQDMIKLNRGRCPYSPAELNNSFVYNPGAPLITWAISRLCGRTTDLAFSRWIQVGFALVACGLAWVSTRALVRPLPGDAPSDGPWLKPVVVWGLGLFVLAWGLNPITGPYLDLLNADALALLTGTAGLTALALRPRSDSSRWFLLATPVPMLALLAKQTGGVVWLGMVLGVWIQERAVRAAARFGLVSGAYIAALVLTLTVWSHGWWSFWTIKVLAKQPMVAEIGILMNRPVLPSLAPPMLAIAVAVAMERRRAFAVRGRTFLSMLLYATLLGGSALITTCKFGTLGANHWGVSALGIATLGTAVVGRALSSSNNHRMLKLAAPLGLLVAIGLHHRMIRPQPGPEEYRSAALFRQVIAQTDLDKTLIDHGSLPYLERNIIPCDRSVPIYETVTGGVDHVDGTVNRIYSQKYRNIICHKYPQMGWYLQMQGAIGIAYDVKAQFPGARRRSVVSHLLGDFVVFEPKPAEAMQQQPTFVLTTSPVVGQRTGRAPSRVNVRFSRPMNPLTLTPDSVYLVALDPDRGVSKWPEDATDLRYDVSSHSVEIATPSFLWPGCYSIVVTDAVRDLAGQQVWPGCFSGRIDVNRFRWQVNPPDHLHVPEMARAQGTLHLRH